VKPVPEEAEEEQQQSRCRSSLGVLVEAAPCSGVTVEGQ